MLLGLAIAKLLNFMQIDTNGLFLQALKLKAMKITRTKEEIKETISRLKKDGNTIGFVPTMGALHDGHGGLIAQALDACDYVVVSIFVNPTQFNNKNDLVTYPRNEEEDTTFLNQFENLILFLPSVSEIYGDVITSETFDFAGLETKMEGEHRPGHFDGVGTVLKHLFTIVAPDVAFFGEKDFQQLQIVRKLVEIEHFPIEIVGIPIVREEDGLAMSSRNRRLTPLHRQISPIIHKILLQVKMLFPSEKIQDINTYVRLSFAAIPELKLEYFNISETTTLAEAISIEENKNYRAFIVVHAGDVRLIDNIALN